MLLRKKNAFKQVSGMRKLYDSFIIRSIKFRRFWWEGIPVCVEMQTHTIWSCLSDLHQLLAVQTTLFWHLKAIQFGKALETFIPRACWPSQMENGSALTLHRLLVCSHARRAPEDTAQCPPARDWLEFLFHHWGRHRCLSPWCPGQGGLSPRTRAALASRVRNEVLEILGTLMDPAWGAASRLQHPTDCFMIANRGMASNHASKCLIFNM